MTKQLKGLAVAAATAVVMCACATSHQAAYDPRPDNIEPKLTQPQAENYDIDDAKTFARYSYPYSVTRPEGLRLFNSAYYQLYRTKEATYVTATYSQNNSKFYYFNSGCAIIDSNTGDQYMLRRLEYFPTDTFFWIDAVNGDFVRFVLVFPPLPADVETVDFFMPSGPERRNFNGAAMSERGLSVKELRKDVDKTYRQAPPRRGRIIY